MKRILRAILSMTLVVAIGFGAIALLTQVFEGEEANIASQEIESTSNDPLAFTDQLTEQDCLPSEIFDSELNSCFYECDDDTDCAALEAQLDQELAALFSGESSHSQSEHGVELAQVEDSVSYEVDVTTIIAPDDAAIASIDQEVWDLFIAIAPGAFIDDNIRIFETYSDVDDDTAASVSPLTNQPNKWLLRVNTAATHRDGELLREDTIQTMIHEFAHILTLEEDQVPPAVWNDATAETCETFFTGEGCANEEAYIHAFFDRYWADIYDELPTDDVSEDAPLAFFETYQERFINDYAATNPGEDIAESFTAFILQPQTEAQTIADEKRNFFYEFPELVTLRTQIRSRIR